MNKPVARAGREQRSGIGPTAEVQPVMSLHEDWMKPLQHRFLVRVEVLLRLTRQAQDIPDESRLRREKTLIPIAGTEPQEIFDG